MLEFYFYGLVLLWGILRYHFIQKNRMESEDEFHYPPIVNFEFYDTLLSKEIPYYNSLSQDGKHYFIGRLKEIRSNIEIQGREDFIVTKEVEVLISACIAQLTFGFKSPIMPTLKGVVVFPEEFYSRLTEAWVKGLAMGNGVVFLSWYDFKEGYLYSTSTYNLGLHEFAHMLRFQSNEMGFGDHRLSYYFDQWEQNGENVFQKIRRGSQNFFREYGGTNRSEFFSVCVENFFEVPKEFMDEQPDLYFHLCYLLKQNPLNTDGDYGFKKENIQTANEYVKKKIPEYEVFHSKLEFQIWQYIKIFKFIAFIPIFILLVFIIDQNEFVLWIRMFMIASIIGLITRIHFYKTVDSIKNKEYLEHFFLRVLPVIMVISLMFEIFFVLL
jgi:MtfA peptidase